MEKKIRIALVVIIVCLSAFISKNWYQLMMVSGDSMLPTLHHMQITVLDKRSETYKTGDIIAFYCEALNAVLVKRIAGAPGDVLKIQDGVLLVNDSVSDFYSEGTIFEYAGIAAQELILDEDTYFVLGDNLAASKDSRYKEIGCISKEDIIGRVIK